MNTLEREQIKLYMITLVNTMLDLKLTHLLLQLEPDEQREILEELNAEVVERAADGEAEDVDDHSLVFLEAPDELESEEDEHD